MDLNIYSFGKQFCLKKTTHYKQEDLHLHVYV